MILYLLIFVFVLFLYNSRPAKRKDVKQLAIVLGTLALFVGFADMLGGYDRYIYCDLFDDTADCTNIGGNYALSSIWGYHKEFGYVVSNILISYVTDNRYIFILLYTIIIYLLIFESIKEYTEDYMLTVILMLALFFFFTFTYLREVMGVAIAWLSVKYIYKRKFWKFLFVIVIAYSFHNSAIVFFPMYFIPIRKFEKKHVVYLMLIFLVLGFTPIPGSLFTRFGAFTGSEERVAYYADEVDRASVRIEYIMEALFFLWIILKNYSRIGNSKKDVVILNIALMFCAILLFFTRSSSGGRLSWYYMMGIFVLIPNFVVGNRSLLKVLLTICFFLYMRVVFAWGIFLSPYKTFFTNGVRDGDPIHLRYEYDSNYEKDKFYRPILKW